MKKKKNMFAAAVAAVAAANDCRLNDSHWTLAQYTSMKLEARTHVCVYVCVHLLKKHVF